MMLRTYYQVLCNVWSYFYNMTFLYKFFQNICSMTEKWPTFTFPIKYLWKLNAAKVMKAH